jgi:hypothetical protein
MGSDAAYTQYASHAPGRLTVILSRAAWQGPDVPGHATISLMRLGGSPTAIREWVIHAGRARSFTFRTPPKRFQVTVHVAPTFSPSQFGQADTRQLGAQVSFRYRLIGA